MIKNNKKKKIIIIVCSVLGFLLLVWLVWMLFIEKIYLFNKSEKELTKAGEKYFKLNTVLLPKKSGDVKTVKLDKLYKEKWLKALYVPKTDKLCDVNSWVKVRLEKDGNYKYYTYLKCGKMESNVDHEGPVITLNGKQSINMDKGVTYQELGVKSVVDNKDGKMLPSAVKIKSTVDTSKIGEYTVTYIVEDSLANKTEVTRVVNVVEMLNTVVKTQTKKTGFYKGDISNNYVWFSGMLWQIIGVNPDNTIKLVTAYTVGNMNYNSKDGTFDNSDMKSWLNDYFYNHISDSSKKFIKEDSTWCNETVSSNDLAKTTCSKQSKKMPVGLVSIDEFNRSLDNNRSYLQSDFMYWLLNGKGKNEGWVNRNDFLYTDNSNFLSFSGDTLLGVRPAINLKEDTAIIDGTGTKYDPYLLGDYKFGRNQDNINTRISGEYIKYAGFLWRIMDVDQDGTTKIVMDSGIRVNDDWIEIKYDTNDAVKVYNPKQAGNVGYQIANKMNAYVNTKLFVTKEISVPVYDEKATYNPKRVDKYKVKLAAPNAYEIFSAKNDVTDYSSYWYLNSSKQEGRKYIMARAGSPYTQPLTDDKTAGVKLVGYLNKDVKITSGKGLRENPYHIKD